MKKVVLLGGGYSIREGIEKDLWGKIKNQENWSLNSIYKIMPYLPKKQIWVDREFFEHECNNLRDLQIKGVELVSKDYHRLSPLRNKITLYGSTRDQSEYYGKEAIKKNKIYYGRMGLCGHFALSLAIGRGYTEIFLLGYDFGSPNLNDKLTHVYQEDIPRLNIRSTGAGRPEVYILKQNQKVRNEISDWEIHSIEKDIKIWNVSLRSNLPYFEKISYEEFFNKL